MHGAVVRATPRRWPGSTVKGIDAVGRGDQGMLDVLKNEVKERALGGITGGHFVRGLAP